MLHLLPHLVTQRSARLWVCARGTDAARRDSISLKVNGIDVPVPTENWQTLSLSAMPLHYQFIDKPTLQPDRQYRVTVDANGGATAAASFATLPDQLGDETSPLRVLLTSCYFTGNKRSRLATTLFTQLDRNGLRPHLRIWAGDQVYLDAPWYEFAVKSHSVPELERLHCAAYARTWFAEQGLATVFAQGANVFCTDDHELWNNAPDPNILAWDTRRQETRDGWSSIARQLRHAFQGDTGTVQRFSVPPLDFLVLDTRVHRRPARARLLSDDQWAQLREWAATSTGLGVLIVGQPIHHLRTTRTDQRADYHLADYQREYLELMQLLGAAKRSNVVLSGDVHFSRVACATFPPAVAAGARETRLTEIISSPLSLVAGGSLLSLFRSWRAAPERPDTPGQDPFGRVPVTTDRALETAAEGATLLELFRRGQRIFCTLTMWRLQDLDRGRHFFRKEYFLGTSA